jgi:hypothetical protein
MRSRDFEFLINLAVFFHLGEVDGSTQSYSLEEFLTINMSSKVR